MSKNDFNDKESYEFLLTFFEEEVLQDRYTYIKNKAENFIESQNYLKDVYLNQSVLNCTLLDYFTDVARLKDFEKIKHINKNKITAYLSYWWLKRKPLQLLNNNNLDADLVFVNEEFVASLIIKDIFYENSLDDKIVQLEVYQELKKHLIYHLRYRLTTAQNLELILLSLQAGTRIGKI